MQAPHSENVSPRSCCAWAIKQDPVQIFSQYSPEKAWSVRDLLHD